MDSLAEKSAPRQFRMRTCTFDEHAVHTRMQEEKDLETLLAPLMGLDNAKVLLAGKPLDIDVGPANAKRIMRLMPRVAAFVRGEVLK
jgi:hypothetical protein